MSFRSAQNEQLLRLWQGNRSNPTELLEKESRNSEFWSIVLNFELSKCQNAFFYPVSRQFEKYEFITLPGPSSWYTKISDIKIALRQEFPATFLAFHSTEPIIGIPNEFNKDYQELILAPLNLWVVNREVHGKYVIYFVTTLKETCFDFNVAQKVGKELGVNSSQIFEAIKTTFPKPKNFEQFTNCTADPYNVHSMRVVPFNSIVNPISNSMNNRVITSFNIPVDSNFYPKQTPEEFVDSVLQIPDTFF